LVYICQSYDQKSSVFLTHDVFEIYCLKSGSERIFIISQHLANLGAK